MNPQEQIHNLIGRLITENVFLTGQAAEDAQKIQALEARLEKINAKEAK